jgi:hypothetical protein
LGVFALALSCILVIFSPARSCAATPHTLRFVVIFALSQIGDRQTLPTLLVALADPLLLRFFTSLNMLARIKMGEETSP